MKIKKYLGLIIVLLILFVYYCEKDRKRCGESFENYYEDINKLPRKCLINNLKCSNLSKKDIYCDNYIDNYKTFNHSFDKLLHDNEKFSLDNEKFSLDNEKFSLSVIKNEEINRLVNQNTNIVKAKILTIAPKSSYNVKSISQNYVFNFLPLQSNETDCFIKILGKTKFLKNNTWLCYNSYFASEIVNKSEANLVILYILKNV